MQARTVIGGVDPGASGALAFLDTTDWSLEVYDMPHWWEEVKSKSKGTTKRKRVDVKALSDLILEKRIATISTERVHAMPQMDVKSIFSFGRFYGQLEMAAAMSETEWFETDPSVWKRIMQVDSDKDYSRHRCGLLVPAAQPILTRKTDHDRAEAILLALYLAFTRRIMPGEITLKPVGVAAPKTKAPRKTKGV